MDSLVFKLGIIAFARIFGSKRIIAFAEIAVSTTFNFRPKVSLEPLTSKLIALY